VLTTHPVAVLQSVALPQVGEQVLLEESNWQEGLRVQEEADVAMT
jgi:hypothetical protein